jgi:small subunit ribosomal protein S5
MVSNKPPRGKQGNAPQQPSSDAPNLSDITRQGATAVAEAEEWKEKVIQIRRVTKVVKGGKKLSFRAVVVVGNGNGKVGVGIGKSNEVIGAIQKGVSEAKKNLVDVPVIKKTIPHLVTVKVVGAQVLFRPASEGTGVIAGGAARSVLELAGIENVLSKSRGKSPLNVAYASVEALRQLRTFKDVAEQRGMTVKQMLMA